MKTRLLLLFIAISLFGYSQSDNEEKDKFNFKSKFYYGIGYNHINAPNINDVLEENNLDKIKTTGISNIVSQIGYQAGFDGFGMDFEWNLRSNFKGSQMMVSSFNFKPYVRVYHNDIISLNIAPYFAIKASSLRIENNIGNTISADNLNEVNDGVIDFTNQSYALGLALHTYFHDDLDFQFKIGYDFSLNSSPWKSQGNYLKNIPKETFDQLYVMLLYPF